MQSWLPISPNSDFSIYNLPFGIFSTATSKPRVGVRIGDYVIDLEALRKFGLLQIPRNILNQNYLNPLIGLGKKTTNRVRLQLQEWLCNEKSALKKHFKHVFYPIEQIKNHLPVKIGDYTDFYSSLEHAVNGGKIFRPDNPNPILPNWKSMPIAYHGRASSIVISETDIIRPKGQIAPATNENLAVFGATKSLDFELEMGMIIGKNNQLGESINTSESEDYVFGFVLFNDWSARDIQRWEYQPLGPFLGKNFASSMSAWVVTIEALNPFRVDTPAQDAVLPYLQFVGQHSFDIELEVSLKSVLDDHVISHTNYKYMYWNIAQQIAHHTINGCNLKIGDLLASGTISGSKSGSYGSMLELSWNAQKPIKLDNNTTRTYLEDGDTLTIKGWAEKENIRVGFGEVSGKILPSN
jgi:fumarylacetoacetase